MYMKEKEIIRLRHKKLRNGQTSLYLDFYFKGVRQYDFLRLYLVPEQTKADKLKNEETLRLANAIKAQRTVEFFNDLHGFTTRKADVNLIQYVECVAENKRKCGKTGMEASLQSLIYHLKKYRGSKIMLRDVTVKYLNGFIHYLSNATSINSSTILKKSTQHNMFVNLRMVIHQAIKDELLTIDPTKSVDAPKTIQAHKEYLTEQEIKLLIDTPCKKEDVKRSFLFCCFTGLRFSDVSSLKWSQISTGNDNTMHINFRQKKTKIENYIPLSENAVYQLPDRSTITNNEPVFQMPTETVMRKVLKQWVSDAGIDKHITFHCSRHTCATLLLNSGVDIYTVKEILGHTDIGTTMQYAKVVDRTKRKAVNSIPPLY